MPFTSDGRTDAAGLAMSITGVILVVIAMRCTSRQEIWFTKELVYRSYVSDLKALLQIQEHWRLAWVPRQANSVDHTLTAGFSWNSIYCQRVKDWIEFPESTSRTSRTQK